MLFDRFNRQINYLRISLTDKCNLRCRYCMPAEGVEQKSHTDILRLEEIHEIAKYAVKLGINKIRLTGGEPLLRKNIEFLIESISAIPGLKDLAMTTNGTLLPQYAEQLKQLGLHRVNISIDSLDPEKYRFITRGGDLNHALLGIKAAQDAGLNPVKINVVLIPELNLGEKREFIKFADVNNLEVRFISKMNLSTGQRNGVEGNTTVGQCDLCNRLRLTCDGFLKPCLFSEDKIDVRRVGLAKAFALALKTKPEKGRENKKELMYQVGG